MHVAAVVAMSYATRRKLVSKTCLWLRSALLAGDGDKRVHPGSSAQTLVSSSRASAAARSFQRMRAFKTLRWNWRPERAGLLAAHDLRKTPGTQVAQCYRGMVARPNQPGTTDGVIRIPVASGTPAKVQMGEILWVCHTRRNGHGESDGDSVLGRRLVRRVQGIAKRHNRWNKLLGPG